MSVEWVRVGDVAEQSRSVVDVEPDQIYKTLGVLNRGRGVFKRSPLSGAETKYPKFSRVSPGQLVYSKLFGWEGSVAVIPDGLDGFVMSPEFPVFELSGRVDPRYVRHVASWDGFVDQMASATTGLGQRRQRVNVSDFLTLQIPIPSLDEQRRIAAHLDSVEQRSSTSPIRRAPEVERALLSALFGRAASTRELGELATVSRGVTPILQPGGPGIVGQASVRWGGVDATRLKGVDPVWESSRGAERRTQVGDLLLNSTGEGTIGRCGLVDGESVGLLTDSKVLTVRVGPELLADYLALYLRSPHGQAGIEAVKGANTTKQTELGVQRAVRLPVPVPSTEEQRRAASAWAAAAVPLGKFDRAERHRCELTASLLPAARNEIFTAMR